MRDNRPIATGKNRGQQTPFATDGPVADGIGVAEHAMQPPAAHATIDHVVGQAELTKLPA